MSNWSLPTTSSVYTVVLTEIDGKDIDCARMFSTAYTAATNVPTGTIRWNDTNKNWDKWSGSAWAALATQYSIDVDNFGGQASSYYRNAGNLNAGTLAGARFNDTSHGARAGGSLHANASITVAGFMSAADKISLADHETRLDNLELAPVEVSVEVRGTNTTTISSTSAFIDWNFEHEDSDGAFNMANGTFTVPAGGAGLYLINAMVNIGAGSVSQYVYLTVKRNGSDLHRNTGYATTTLPAGAIQLSLTKRLAVGDTIQFFTHCNTGTNTYGGGTYAYSAATINKILG